MDRDFYYCVVTWEKKPFANVKTYVWDNSTLPNLNCEPKQVMRLVRMVMNGTESISYQNKWYGAYATRHEYKVNKTTYFSRLQQELDRLESIKYKNEPVKKQLARCKQLLNNKHEYTEPDIDISKFVEEIQERDRHIVNACFSYDPWFDNVTNRSRIFVAPSFSL